MTGLTVGTACAMKATAWPAFAIIAAMFGARDGVRTAARFVVASAVTTAALIVVTAPSLVANPRALFENTVAFPLGLTSQHTPAASPLPGHLLAGAGHAGHVAAVLLLLAAGLAVVASLVFRPLMDVRAATVRLAIALTLMFALAPEARFGYFAYPAALLAWLALAGHPIAPTLQVAVGSEGRSAIPAIAETPPAPGRATGRSQTTGTFSDSGGSLGHPALVAALPRGRHAKNGTGEIRTKIRTNREEH